MFIIVGLGNPTLKYDKTRHNVGFDAIDVIAEKNNIVVKECKYKAQIGKGFIAGEKVILVKPLTYMNLSGESIREVLTFFKEDATKHLIVLYDDISLEPGQLRIRKKGSAGGHNGIKNIITHLGHDVFIRIKIGVGEKPTGADLANYVLDKFSKEDRKTIENSFVRTSKAVETIINDSADAAMNQFNGKNKE